MSVKEPERDYNGDIIRFCSACRTARKKQAQRRWCRMNGYSRKET